MITKGKIIMKLINKAVILTGALILPLKSYASTIYVQDFESGLNANESIVITSSGYGLTNTATLGNGSYGVGHTSGFDGSTSAFVDVYTLMLDLSTSTNSTLSFDFSVDTSGIHEWGVLASGSENRQAFSGTGSGRAVFDLSVYDGQANLALSIGLGVQGQTTLGQEGYFIDNIMVETSPVPLPASIWLFGTGIVALIGIARRKQT